MELPVKIIVISLLVGAPFVAVSVYYVLQLTAVPPVPTLENTWWAHGPAIEDESIKPFKITFSQQIINDLRNRLKNVRTLTPALEGTQQQYGINPTALKPILDYWADKYDWAKRETFLNQFPHFKTNIQGLNIHYIHVKPPVPPSTPVVPLLMLHGFPGSVREFYKIIPLLSRVHKMYGFTFEIVAPSLPGYGFSDAAVRPGLGTAEMCVIMKNLMLRLGHRKFYVQGGDWGSVIITQMAILFPEVISGLHTNMAVPLGKFSVAKLLAISPWPSLVISGEYARRMYPLQLRLSNFLEETGYLHMQATKPDTVGVGINDSPAGLAAYILEKFSTLSNADYKMRNDAGLLESFTYDELIDNLMFYWVPQSITTASRLYAESLNKRQLSLRLYDIPISMDVPCAVARFPKDVYYFPNFVLEDTYQNLVHTSNFMEGGHFAALEVPHLLSEDIFEAVHKMRNLTK